MIVDYPRAGETGGMHWRIFAEPIAIYPKPAARRQISPEQRQGEQQQQNEPDAQPVNWTTFRVIASVSWARDGSVSAETVRLGKSD